MKLIGKLKKQVDKEEVKKTIAEAKIELTDEEKEQVSGGVSHSVPRKSRSRK